MIGQEQLRTHLSNLIDADKLPRVILLVGASGSGKRTMAKFIASKSHKTLVEKDISISAMRDMILDANTINSNILYLIPHIDNMSINAKNSILKLLEDVPRDSYFILTAKNVNDVLPTILSRVYRVDMSIYSKQELSQYCLSKGLDSKSTQSIIDICNTPGEIDMFTHNNIEDFDKFLSLTVSHISDVTTANALKLATTISDDAFNLQLFWHAYIKKIAESCADMPSLYHSLVSETSKCLRSLHTKGTNRFMLCTLWILNIRRAYDDTRC